eukprot:TRINITY_DN67550_c3_g4_i1.p1 TRINITY_DN67550_c3_g4~~TRINITY_DN67550_c3_g4_i1.p1  ORF type:complete len:736 (-),score=20.64 TRINITY_DN67550_c3_g4_i1:277-2424(-)
MKVVLQSRMEDVRRLEIAANITLPNLLCELQERYADRVKTQSEFLVKYKDEEGDSITIANQKDWNDCLRLYQDGLCSQSFACSDPENAGRALKLYMFLAHEHNHGTNHPSHTSQQATTSPAQVDKGCSPPTVPLATEEDLSAAPEQRTLNSHTTFTTSYTGSEKTASTHTSHTTTETNSPDEEVPLLKRHMIFPNTSQVPASQAHDPTKEVPKAEEFLSHHLTEKAPLAGNWTLGKMLGSGGWGKVYRAMHQQNGQLIAVKQVHVKKGPSVTNELKNLDREITALRSLNHPKIVRYLGLELDEGPESTVINILMEFVAGGSIASLLVELQKPFSEKVIQSYTHQILVGLKFLHDNEILHRDIKGANVLIDRRGNVKLSDFGASKRISDLVSKAEGSSNLKGTIKWMAPEVCTGSGGAKASDIWSLGCTVVEMATGESAWPNLSNEWTALFHIGSKKGTPTIPGGLSMEAQDFLDQCFRMEPNDRPTAAQLLEHAWFSAANFSVSSEPDSSESLKGASMEDSLSTINSDLSYLRKASMAELKGSPSTKPSPLSTSQKHEESQSSLSSQTEPTQTPPLPAESNVSVNSSQSILAAVATPQRSKMNRDPNTPVETLQGSQKMMTPKTPSSDSGSAWAERLGGLRPGDIHMSLLSNKQDVTDTEVDSPTTAPGSLASSQHSSLSGSDSSIRVQTKPVKVAASTHCGETIVEDFVANTSL